MTSKLSSFRLTIKLILIISFSLPLISNAFISFPTKIDTKAERINIQTVLNTVMIPSPNLTVDGVLGKKSIQAIQSFQESKGLVPDGKVGPLTRSTLESAQRGSTSTSYTPPITTTSGCLPGAIFNTLNGQRCNSTSSSLTGCNGTNKFNTITGALCTNTTTSVTGGGGGGGGGSSTTIIPACTGSSTQPCTITNGQGNQSRICNSGNWSSYSSCSVISCNSGYQEVNNACASTTCTGLSTQPCTIANGTGNQSRTCTLGAWSSYGSCSPISCNNGYSISGNTCIVTPDTTKPTITSFTIPSTSSSLSVPITTLTAGDDKGVTGFLLNESSSTPNASSGSWTSIPSTIYTFLSQGLKTLYAWAKDTAGNVSNSLSRQTTITTSSNWQTGLISWWKLDGNANDSQGSNNGTNGGAVSTSTGCVSGSCYDFGGNENYIVVRNSQNIYTENNDYSMAGWFYRDTEREEGLLGFSGEVNDTEPFSMLNCGVNPSSGCGWLVRGDSGTNAMSLPMSTTIGLGSWHHVVMTKSGNRYTIYLDGVQNATTTNTFNDTFNERNILVMGDFNEVGVGGPIDSYYDGKIDEVMLWNRGLNSSEVNTLFNTFNIVQPPVCTGPTTQPCTIVNGTGSQSRTCSSGAWSGWNTCSPVSCNSGYTISGNTCIADNISSDTNYNGVCSTGSSITDADCFAQEHPGWPTFTLKNENNYTNKVYIDPNWAGCHSGAIDCPYSSWTNISWQSNTAYIQKRGTSLAINSKLFIPTGLSNIYIGAYGSGARPILIGNYPGDLFEIHSENTLFRDIHLQNPGSKLLPEGSRGSVIYIRGDARNSVVYDCTISNSGFDGIFSWADGTKILYTEIYNIYVDAIWVGNAKNIEVGHTNIHDINKMWFDYGSDTSIAGGDGIQFEGGIYGNSGGSLYRLDRWWVHHTTINRSNSGNKFGIIAEGMADEFGIFENNTVSGPRTDGNGGASVFIGGQYGPDGFFESGRNVIVRNNTINGPSPTAVWIESDSVTVEGNTFNGVGNAVMNAGGSNLTVKNNSFSNILGQCYPGDSISVFQGNTGVCSSQ